MKFKSYFHAVRAGYGLPSSPPDYPDPPEFDDVPHGCYRSACCGSEVDIECPIHTKLERKRCTCCGTFCAIDEDSSISAYIDALKDGGYDD